MLERQSYNIQYSYMYVTSVRYMYVWMDEFHVLSIQS